MRASAKWLRVVSRQVNVSEDDCSALSDGVLRTVLVVEGRERNVESVTAGELPRIVCVCGSGKIIPPTLSRDELLLVCNVCGFLQHASCMRVVWEHQIPDPYVCIACSYDQQRSFGMASS